MMLRKFLLVLVLFISVFADAQKMSEADKKLIEKIEDTLAPFAKQMIFDTITENRFYADSVFTKALVRALKLPYSFYYHFDSIITVSIQYPADSTFRIFTWQLERDEAYFRQHGAIQMNTKDGSLKLFPLIDKSDIARNPTDSVRDNLNWIGGIYYGLVTKEFKGKKYYTLFGYDDNDIISTKKWLDVLTFTDDGKPQFGGRFFDYANDSIKPLQPAYRFCLEYKKDAHARMVYDEDIDMIIFDHLISESNEPQKRFTLIPDGDYEAFKWSAGKWVHVDKLFNQKTPNGQYPVPEPLYDDNGNANEKVLQEKTDKNKDKKPPIN